MSDRDARAARERAAEWLDTALWHEKYGRHADALLAFDEAVAQERWAIYYEERADYYAMQSAYDRRRTTGVAR